MPNGKTHDKITYITTPIVGVGAFGMLTNIKNGPDLMSALILTLIVTGAYFFASMMFNGDLDTNSKPYNRWWLFKMIWVPYQVFFNHRSFWTHGIIIGTVVRLLYLSPLIIGIFLLFNISLGEVNWFYIIPILAGLELGNITHTVSDAIGSEF
jgi:uncharacterized metal-binding protein